ncbi:MAG: class I SAM-dependent methyltransferase [Eubacteriales bacterium]|nr:class I SAM-dependent methyltransferase [Eubacteriales bacterium]MDD4461875.1 class I SAM-dependent methyltransferase [Eubacteriales bacterium]
MYIANRWQDYELMDAGSGDKLERWGDYILQRPDPQAIWPHDQWPKPDALYLRDGGGGRWQARRPLPKTWQIRYPGLYGDLVFQVEPTGFKHTGLFPEQAANWDFTSRIIHQAKEQGRTVRVLNLFAYTGGATVASAMAGADEVVHLDASKGMVSWARQNVQLSGLGDCYIRYIVDDVLKFVEREIRRGRRYDGIIMDPPAYGRGPNGELWKIEDSLYDLIDRCSRLLSDQPLFFIINAYSNGLSPAVAANMLSLVISSRYGGQAEAEELALPVSRRPLFLPCGFTGRWTGA